MESGKGSGQPTLLLIQSFVGAWGTLVLWKVALPMAWPGTRWLQVPSSPSVILDPTSLRGSQGAHPGSCVPQDMGDASTECASSGGRILVAGHYPSWPSLRDHWLVLQLGNLTQRAPSTPHLCTHRNPHCITASKRPRDSVCPKHCSISLVKGP